MDTLLRTMGIPNSYPNDATAFTLFDKLNVRQCSRDAVAHLRETASTPVSTRALGLSENLWKQTGIAGLTIGKQDEAMTIR